MNNKNIRKSFIIILVLVLGVCLYHYSSKPIVMSVGGLDDVCGTRSIILVNHAPLHNRPSSLSAVRNNLSKKQMVNVCSELGQWSAVIVSEKEKDCRMPYDLEVGSYEYSGPCQFGWVHSTSLQMVAD